MVKIFYRSGAEILLSQSETELSAIGRENVIWIDTLVALVCSLVIIRWAKNLLFDTGKALTSKLDIHP